MSEAASIPPVRRRFPWGRYLLAFVIIAIVMAAPVVVSVMSSDYAAAHGCQIDEGSVHPCIIDGHDQGELFYSLGMMGWLVLLTMPLGLVVGGVLFVVMLIHLAARSRGPR